MNNLQVKIFWGDTSHPIDSRFMELTYFNVQHINLYEEMKFFVMGMSNKMIKFNKNKNKKNSLNYHRQYKKRIYDLMSMEEGFSNNFLKIEIYIGEKKIDSVTKEYRIGKESNKSVLNFLSSDIFGNYFDFFMESMQKRLKILNQYNDTLTNEVAKYMTEPLMSSRFNRLEKLNWKEKSKIFKKIENGEELTQKDLNIIYFNSKEKKEEV